MPSFPSYRPRNTSVPKLSSDARTPFLPMSGSSFSFHHSSTWSRHTPCDLFKNATSSFKEKRGRRAKAAGREENGPSFFLSVTKAHPPRNKTKTKTKTKNQRPDPTDWFVHDPTSFVSHPTGQQGDAIALVEGPLSQRPMPRGD